jgi:hypothetical protein
MAIITATQMRVACNSVQAQLIERTVQLLDKQLRACLKTPECRNLHFYTGMMDLHVRDATLAELRQAGYNARVRTHEQDGTASFYIDIKW